MTDHAALAAQFDAAAEHLWASAGERENRATELLLLGVAHAARALDPTARAVYLTEHEDGEDMMTFTYVITETGAIGHDTGALASIDEMDDADAEEWDERVRMLQPSALHHQEFWVEHGGRRQGYHGELLIDQVFAAYAEKHAAVADPMPDPNDLAAVREWLDRQEANR